jgi:hypothetical protein
MTPSRQDLQDLRYQMAEVAAHLAATEALLAEVFEYCATATLNERTMARRLHMASVARSSAQREAMVADRLRRGLWMDSLPAN